MPNAARMEIGSSVLTPSAPQAATDSVQSRDSTMAPPTDRWVGKCTAPKGTALTLSGGNGKYEMMIRNLDGSPTFPGVANGNQIDSTRDAISESFTPRTARMPA